MHKASYAFRPPVAENCLHWFTAETAVQQAKRIICSWMQQMLHVL